MAETISSPLAGKRIVITRAAAQGDAMARELSAHGAIPVVLPLMAFADPQDFAPLDEAIMGMERFDWMILTSAQTVRALVKRGEELKRSLIGSQNKLRIAAVGPVTAEAAQRAGLPVEYVAETHTGVSLAEGLGNRLQRAKVFLPRSDRANPDLPVALKGHGALVTEVIAYRTLRPTGTDQEKLREVAEGAADAVLFFSPSAVQYFVEVFGSEKLRSLQDKLAITAVGPVTAHALHEAGVHRTAVAGDTTAAAVVEALEDHFASTMKQARVGAKRV